MENDEILKQVPLFSGLNPRNLRSLAKSCTTRRYKAGDTIVKQDEPGVGLFIIVSGKVKIVKGDEQGNRMEIAQHTPGDVIGEFAVIDGALRTADVIAVEDTACLVLAAWSFNSFMESHPEVALQILPVVVKRFRETNKKLMELTSPSV